MGSEQAEVFTEFQGRSSQKGKRAARIGKNPRTGETLKIAATTVPRSTPGAAFKAAVAKKKKAALTAQIKRRSIDISNAFSFGDFVSFGPVAVTGDCLLPSSSLVRLRQGKLTVTE